MQECMKQVISFVGCQEWLQPMQSRIILWPEIFEVPCFIFETYVNFALCAITHPSLFFYKMNKTLFNLALLVL